MRTTIDAAGRLVIPKEIRRAAGLQPGDVLDVRWHDGRIEIEPAPLHVRLERRGRWVVAVPTEDVPTLTAAMVEQTRDAVLRERAESM